jgi:hypothetical protein
MSNEKIDFALFESKIFANLLPENVSKLSTTQLDLSITSQLPLNYKSLITFFPQIYQLFSLNIQF